MSGAMQFSRRWTSVVVPVAMLIKYVFARIILWSAHWSSFVPPAINRSPNMPATAESVCNV
eukprot:scaffold97281_cov76-Phaeocystis_antarctica.AAC.2